MTWVWATPGGWLLRSAVGGGLLLLVAWVLMRRARQPARRQRLGEFGIAAALTLAFLGLAPAWIIIPGLVSEPVSPPKHVISQPPNSPLSPANAGEGRGVFPAATQPWQNQAENIAPALPFAEREMSGAMAYQLHSEPIAGNPQADLSAEPVVPDDVDRRGRLSANASNGYQKNGDSLWGAFSWRGSIESLLPWLMAAYAVGSIFFVGRWLLGHLALWRLLRTAKPAPKSVTRLFIEMARKWRIKPRLLVSSRLRVPLSCGLWRPVVVVPASWCEREASGQMAWVFAHELTHLERRDAWACTLFGLGQALYFCWPWFWWLRRQVRLCQEYIADAAVVRQTGEAEDYAEFLLSLSKAPAVPAGATGVLGNSSDLFRRVTMLLQTPYRVEKCCSLRWTLAVAGGLLALAVIVAGIGPQAKAAPDPKADAVASPAPDNDKKDPLSQDKEEPPKDAAKKKPAPANPQGLQPPAGFPGQDQQEVMRRMMENMQRMRPQMGFGFGFSHHARLGVQVSKPSEALVDQLDLPKDQGQVIEEVVPDSPAAKAGLKTHDLLLELNGKAVSADVQEIQKMVQDIKADTKVDAVVLRKGKKETVKGITLPEAKQEAFPGFPPAGRGGFGQGQAFPQAFPPAGAGNFPQPRLGFGNAFQPGQNTIMTTITRTKDSFTTRYEEGSLIIHVTGKVADGQSKLGKIQVQDGGVAHEYESVDKVPDQYKDKVKNLVEMSEKNSVKIEIKTP
jgi:beta-lactamase regulating signal transducer with metallopeptidase domain